MGYTALEAAWAKYNKAVRELAVLRANVERFLARDPYTVEVRLDPDTGWWIASTRIVEEPPPVLGVQVGCIAHEAYSALNHVTWALGARKLGHARGPVPTARLARVGVQVHQPTALDS